MKKVNPPIGIGIVAQIWDWRTILGAHSFPKGPFGYFLAPFGGNPRSRKRFLAGTIFEAGISPL